MKALLVFLALCYLVPSASGQQNMHFIEATSKYIKIVDEVFVQDGELVPHLNPDTYYVRLSGRPKKMAYYTDKDSIFFWVRAGDTFNFAIVLNGKDTCYQRVTTENPHKVQYTTATKGGKNDTLSFVLGPNNAIHLEGKINHSETLDLIFDTGASIGVLSEGGKARGAALRPDNKNVFEIGSITIQQAPISFIDYRGNLKADGVVGYNTFEGQVVEINYDKSILVIHHGAFDTTGYLSTAMQWRGSAMFAEGAIAVKQKTVKGLFLFDTGSKWALSLTKAFATENNLYGAMEKIGTLRARGADGKTIKSDRVQLPAFHLAGLSLLKVPTDLELPQPSGGTLAFNILGNDVLKRFNTILDYKKGRIYLKPNSLQQAPYTKTFDEKDLLMLAALVMGNALIALWCYRIVKQHRRQKSEHAGRR